MNDISPALAGRLGMVWIEPLATWQAVAQQWLKTSLPPPQRKNMSLLGELCDSVLPAAFEFLQQQQSTVLNTDLTQQLLQLVGALLEMYRHDILTTTDDNAPDPEEPLLPPVARTLFLFAVSWTLASYTPRAEWTHIEDLIRSFTRGTTSFPERGKLFSCVFYPRGPTWLPWEAVPTLPTFTPCFTSVQGAPLIPIAPTATAAYVTRAFMLAGRSVLVVGQHGMGKSLFCESVLRSDKRRAVLHLSMRSASQGDVLRDAAACISLAHRRQGLVAPPVGESLTIFLDDIGQNDARGTGVLETVRELVACHGWRDCTTGQHLLVSDTNVLCCMAEEKSASSSLPPRLARLLPRIAIPELTEEEKVAVFWKQCTDWIPSRMLKDAGPTIAAATLQAISSVKGEISGTSVGSLFIFDLRTVSLAIRRLAAVLSSISEELDLPGIGVLWQNEMALLLTAANGGYVSWVSYMHARSF